MKKIFIALAATFCLLVGFTSCETKTSAIMLEFGWDLDNNNTLSFDNFDILYGTDICQNLATALEHQGFTYDGSHGHFIYATPLTQKEATKKVKAALSEANTDQLVKEGAYGYDFVVRYDFFGEKIEVYRGK